MIIDIHAHAYRKPFQQVHGTEPFPTPEQLIEYYDRAGIQKAVLLPVIGPEFYLPQSNEEILEMATKFSDRFIPFCNVHPFALSNAITSPLGTLMKKYKELGCRGLGEVTCNLPFRDPFVRNLFKGAVENDWPVTIHISHRIGNSYGLYDDPGLPQLEELFTQLPGLKILGHSQAFWAEIGELQHSEDRAGYPSYPICREGAVPRLMRRFPGLYGDLSARSGYNALNRDLGYAVKFLNEFQDRLLFGLDICSPPAPHHDQLLSLLKQLLSAGEISSSTYAKITGGNAERLLGLAITKN